MIHLRPDDRPRFSGCYRAHAVSAGAARGEVSSFAARNGAAVEDLERVRLAVSEAVTNAVVHAYPAGTPGLVHVSAVVAGRELSVIVADDGCGIDGSAESPGLGFGLNLIEHACASFTITARPGGGTVLEMRFLLSTAAAHLEPQTAGSRRVASLNPRRVAGYLRDGAPEASI
jgi:anti-sigma regulatory factor (Ser/Thr protein kinase)